MGSTFLGLTIGYSGVSAYKGAIDATANNIANAKTKGYSRQEVIRTAADGLRSYATYGMVGTGVLVTDVAQIRSFFYDVKYWTNNGSIGEFDIKEDYMKQIQSYYYYEEEKNGVGQMLSRVVGSMEDLLNNSTNMPARQSFVNSCQAMADQINEFAIALERLQSECNDQISMKVDEINSIARQMATLNKQINTVEQTGITANELRDQRALLVDQLSKIASVEVEESPLPSNMKDQYGDPIMTGATCYRVTIGGQTLVQDFSYCELDVVARKEKLNQSDADGLFDVIWKNGTHFNMCNEALGGELQGLIEMRDGNNAENLQGKVKSADAGADTIVLTDANGTEISQMILPESGKITLNYHEFTYDKFEFDAATGEYTFHLVPEKAGEDALTAEEAARILNGPAVVGNTVDYMGIPYYMSNLNEFCRSYAKAFNDIHVTAKDYNGNQGRLFFTGVDILAKEEGDEFTFGDGDAVSSDSDTYYCLTARNFRVAKALTKDPALVATASEIVNGIDRTDKLQELRDLHGEAIISRFTPMEFLETMLSDITISTQDSVEMLENYETLGEVLKNQRLSVAGVDEDEEAMNMIYFREAYNLNSKVISVMNELYNKLINETGV